MAASDCKPQPKKNEAFHLPVDLWLTTGLINSGAAGLDSEVSKDGGAYTDCTNECVEIGSSGSYALELTSTEMNADLVRIQVKSSTTNAITAKYKIVTTETGDWIANATQVGGQTASAAGTVTFPGTIASTTNITAGTITTTTNLTNLPAITANWITAAGINADAFTAAKFASDVGTEFAAAVWANGTRSLTTLAGLTVDTVTTLTNLPSIPANWLTAAGTAADFTVEIQAGLSTLTAAQVNAEVDTALADVGLTTTITGRIDAAISTRLASASYTAPLDAAGTRSAIGLASANLDTQIGTLATGANLAIVAGYLDTEVAAIKLVTDHLATALVLDGAVYQFTANALELGPGGGAGIAQAVWDLATSGIVTVGSIGEFVLGLNAGAGSGAFTVTVTVTDGTDPLQNASIRLIEGVTPYTATTNASGVATFSLDAATYSIAITKAGYQFTPSTIVVTAAGNFNKAMTEVVVSPPADPTLCRVYAYLQNKSGVAVAGKFMTAKLLTPATAGAFIITTEITSAASDADGLVYLDLILPSEITPAALKYTIKVVDANFNAEVTPTGATYSLGQLVT